MFANPLHDPRLHSDRHLFSVCLELGLVGACRQTENHRLHFPKTVCAKLITAADLPDSPGKHALSGETEICLTSSLFKKAMEASKMVLYYAQASPEINSTLVYPPASPVLIYFFYYKPLYICWHLASVAEKAMAPHSSTLAWQIPWTEEPGRLQSMGSLRVGHDWAASLSLFTFMHWTRQWQPTLVFLPGESQGRGSLVGCCLWGHTESYTTEAT